MNSPTRERVVISGVRALVGALGTIVVASVIVLDHPEVVIESCSLAIVLLLVWLDRVHAANSARSAALHNLAEELEANYEYLYERLWSKPATKILEEVHRPERGLRYFYDHVATSATEGALLNGALGRRKDSTLVQLLHRWQRTAEICNTRFKMAELHLFFLQPNTAGMKERLYLHASIARGPAKEQRDEFEAVLRILAAYAGEKRLPKSLVEGVESMRTGAAVEKRRIDAITRTLWDHIEPGS